MKAIANLIAKCLCRSSTTEHNFTIEKASCLLYTRIRTYTTRVRAEAVYGSCLFISLLQPTEPSMLKLYMQGDPKKRAPCI